MTDKQLAKLWGSNGRIKGGKLQIMQRTNIRRDLDDLTVKQAIAYLSKLDAEGKLDIFAETDYGDPVSYIYLDTWVDVTPQKREEMIKQVEARESAQRHRDEMEIRRLKATRPDLFK